VVYFVVFTIDILWICFFPIHPTHSFSLCSPRRYNWGYSYFSPVFTRHCPLPSAIASVYTRLPVCTVLYAWTPQDKPSQSWNPKYLLGLCMRTSVNTWQMIPSLRKGGNFPVYNTLVCVCVCVRACFSKWVTLLLPVTHIRRPKKQMSVEHAIQKTGYFFYEVWNWDESLKHRACNIT
jgi:hypothetical protein